MKSNFGKADSFLNQKLYKELCSQYPSLSLKEYVVILGILTGSLKVTGVLITTEDFIQVILRGSIDLCPKDKTAEQLSKALEDESIADLDIQTLTQFMQFLRN